VRISIKRLCGTSGSAMIAAVLLAMGIPSNSTAQTQIKLATMVPSGTSYHHSLQALGEKWRKDSNGAIALKIYADGTMGGEAEIVKRIRHEQLQAAILTVEGLSEIDPSVSALQKMPLMYRSLDEAAYVRARLAPELERRLAAKGFVVLFWADAGWVRIFSKDPGMLPQDFKKMKIFVTAGDNAQANLLKSVGYDPVPLEWADVLPSLQTGMVNAVPTIPFHTLAGQFYLSTHHMLEVNWLPLVGGLVISKKTWDALQPSEREFMLKSASACGEEFQVRGREENKEAVEAMQKRGLQVHPVNKQAEEEWRRFSENLYPKIRGGIVPADMFDQVVQVLREHRAVPGVSGK
jgi:TRAP-type C4-dicarboxylate transport system substrate-binding protein